MFSSRLVHTAPYSTERSCPATTHTKDGRVENKQILSKTKVSRYDIVFFNKYWSPFVTCFIYNKLKVTFMNSFNNTGHYRKQLHYLAIKKNAIALRPNTFFTEIHRLLVRGRLPPAQTIAKVKCRTPQSLTVVTRAALSTENKVKVKIKFIFEQSTKDQRWSRGIALLFL